VHAQVHSLLVDKKSKFLGLPLIHHGPGGTE
jgi:hypothetical protein